MLWYTQLLNHLVEGTKGAITANWPINYIPMVGARAPRDEVLCFRETSSSDRQIAANHRYTID